jgi:hypothetical protein
MRAFADSAGGGVKDSAATAITLLQNWKPK